MKNIKIIYTIFLLLAVSTLFSCKKFLDEKSDTSLVVPSTIKDFQALLDNTFAQRTTPSTGDASSDDFFVTNNSYNGFGESFVKGYTWKPFPYYYGDDDWSSSYRAIYNANLSLEGIKKIAITSGNNSEWSNVKGSALFYRSYFFLCLIWNHGKAYDENESETDLGIVLRLQPNSSIKSVRSSVTDSYNQIISDAKESLNYLPNLPSTIFRPSKAAAYGLLARTYLSMRQYSNALLYADSCLQIQNYLMDYNADPGVNDLTFSSFAPFNNYLENKEIIYYTQPNQYINQFYQFFTGKVDTTLYNSYDVNDWRKTGFFYPWQGYFAFKGSYSGSLTTFFNGITTDEIYLTRAECYARENDKDAALADLNTLMIKRWKNNGSWIPFTAINANEALDKILIERRKELLYRCLRWIDIKRLNKEGRNIIPIRKLPDGTLITLQPNANYYALPLPTDIIDITGMAQNPYP